MILKVPRRDFVLVGYADYDWELFEGRALLKSPNLAWLDFKKVGVE